MSSVGFSSIRVSQWKEAIGRDMSGSEDEGRSSPTLGDYTQSTMRAISAEPIQNIHSRVQSVDEPIRGSIDVPLEVIDMGRLKRVYVHKPGTHIVEAIRDQIRTAI